MNDSLPIDLQEAVRKIGDAIESEIVGLQSFSAALKQGARFWKSPARKWAVFLFRIGCEKQAQRFILRQIMKNYCPPEESPIDA